jgi:hypothetical protein
MKRLLLIAFTSLSIHVIAQPNSYPTTGDITIYNYSPSLILQRNTADGGFTEGIQTRLQDGTDNWYFGALLTGQWIVSKGNHSNPKMTVLENGNVGIGTTNPSEKLTIGGNHEDTKLRLYSTGNGSDEPSNLSLWASEPHWTYSGTGIGYNVNGSPYYGRVDNTRGSSYVRFLPGETKFEFQNTSGNYIKAITIKDNGNIGIGTEDPGVKLDVNGTASLGKTYHNVLKVGALESAPAYFYIDTKIPFNDNPAPQLHITGYNYGNANKAIKLTIGWYVYNNKFFWSQYKSDLGYYNPTSIKLGTYDDAGTIRVRIEIANDGSYWSSYFISATDINGSSSNYAGWSSTLGTMPATTGNITSVTEYAGIIYSNAGNMLIGKNTQDNKTYKLDVVGKIRADEVVVNTTGADFVFEKDYKLPTIEHVANYVQENKHLPDIPSANEMVKNGVSMGDMQVKLLQKVEELTLYAIQQNDSKKELEKKYNALLEKVETLTKQIEKK